jgi:chromosome segregation ATPase
MAADWRRERGVLVDRLRESDERQMALAQRMDSLQVVVTQQREALVAWQGRGMQAEASLSALEPMMAQLRDELTRAKRREAELEALLHVCERCREPHQAPGEAGRVT